MSHYLSPCDTCVHMLKPTHGERRDFVTDEMQQGSSSVMLLRLLGACCFIICWKQSENLLREKKKRGTLYSELFSPSIQRLLLLQHECYSWSKRILWHWIFGTLLVSAWWGATQKMGAGRDYYICMEICSGLNPFQVHVESLASWSSRQLCLSAIYIWVTRCGLGWPSCTWSCHLFCSDRIMTEIRSQHRGWGFLPSFCNPPMIVSKNKPSQP